MGKRTSYSVPHGAVGSNARPDHSMLRSCSSETRMQAVHEHLKIESPDKEVEAIVESVKNRVNVMWKEKQLPKFIQFGRDGKGENSHALNGPTVKAVLRDPNLIIDTIEAMAPVYALMEQGRYQLGQKVEKVKVRTEGSGASVGDAPVTKKQGGGRPRTVIKPKPKKKNERGMGFGNIVSDDSDEEGHVGQGGAHETCHAGPPSNGETVESEVSAPNLPDELRDAERVGKELSYSQRVGIAFVAFMAFYTKLHAAHDRKASDVSENERCVLAEQAIKMSLEMQRAFIALMGTHKRRTYAHDFVYGLHALYTTFAKPWNAATEGSEHAHLEKKIFFHRLACNNGKAKSSCYQVLKLRLVKQQMVQDYARAILPWSEYCASRCGRIFGAGSSPNSNTDVHDATASSSTRKRKRQHKRSCLSVKGQKKYKVDHKMGANSENIRKNICLSCQARK